MACVYGIHCQAGYYYAIDTVRAYEISRGSRPKVKQGKAKNRNDFIVIASQRELKALEEADIDADFAEMANDEEQRLNQCFT